MVKTEVQNKVIIGSRESRLAVLQSEMVRDYIKTQHPELDVEILTMKTTGDKILDRTLEKRMSAKRDPSAYDENNRR